MTPRGWRYTRPKGVMTRAQRYATPFPLTAIAVRSAIMQFPGLYETEEGRRFHGMPCSQVPSQLTDCGWYHVHKYRDRGLLEDLGLEVVTARYVGGVRRKSFCYVVVASEDLEPASCVRCLIVKTSGHMCEDCGENV